MKQVRLETGICHLLVGGEQTLKHFLLGTDLSELGLQIDASLVDDWLYTGAIYINGQRQRTDTAVSDQSVIRLHTRRKRYPVSPLQPRIVEMTDGYVVLDKPSGLPTHPTLDNFIENAKFILETELNEPLFTTHRLDIPTSGLLVFARHKEAQSRLNRYFSRGRVSKTYLADAEAALTPGPYTHYIDPQTRVPRTIDIEPHPNWWECRLTIESAQSLAPLRYRHQVQLHTGKTHQIRAQFAALGAPICGDITYGAHSVATEFGLACVRLAFQDGNRNYDWKRNST